MGFKIQIQARSDREAQIVKSLESPTGKMDFYEFRNTHFELGVIRIDIRLPVYRIENFRTFTDQKEYITREKLDPTYFRQGQEIESVQQVQHGLLYELAQKGKADSVVPVVEVLKREGQRLPILLSASGVVVNGNRRLAAMRELYAENSELYSKFGHVDCAILPSDATADEIVDIEAELQAKPETKLDYDWIGDGELIAELLRIHGSTKAVANKLGRSEREIKNSLQALSEADLYLKDWAQAEGEYSRIRDDAEQLFKDLPKQISNKEPDLQDASRVIAWTLYDNKDQLPGRLYSFNSAFGKLADDVLDRMAADLGVSLEPSDEQSSGNFEIDFGEEADSGKSYFGLVDALKGEDSRDAAIEALIDACQTSIETEKGQKSGEAAFKALTQVHSKLAAVDLSKASDSTYSGISKQLKAIDGQIKKLSESLSQYLQS